MTIIFDFNRTVFDPDSGALVPGALRLLTTLKERGVPLHLVSKREAGRDDALQRLGIAHFFLSTSFVDDKEERLRELISESSDTTYVIGDHLHNEIRIGNRHGAKTIWLKRGRFASLTPESDEDHPWRTVSNLHEIELHLID